MSRHSHVLVSLFTCFLFIAAYFTPSSSSQSIWRSLSLNGTNQYVTAPSSSSLNIIGAITVEGWIKLNSTGAYQAIVSREAFQQAGSGGGYRLVVTDLGKLRLDLFQSHNTYTTAIGTTTITTGVWHQWPACSMAARCASTWTEY
jgi:hypothetical protein